MSVRESIVCPLKNAHTLRTTPNLVTRSGKSCGMIAQRHLSFAHYCKTISKQGNMLSALKRNAIYNTPFM